MKKIQKTAPVLVEPQHENGNFEVTANGEISETVTETPTEEPEPTAETAKPVKLNFAQIAKNVKDENSLLAKWDKLNTTEKELDSFFFGGDHAKDILTLKDSDSGFFQTSNTFIIEKVTEYVKNLITVKKAEIEADLEARRLTA